MTRKCRKRLLHILLGILGLTTISYGQSQQYTGQLIDNESKLSIKEANVTKKGLVIKTDYSGVFQIDAIAGDTLVINHPEYEEALVTIPTELQFTITLTKRVSKTNSNVYSLDEVDQKPEPINGFVDFYKQWSANVLKLGGYPKKARQNGIEGKVLIYFIIDELGQVIESGVEKGLGYGCDEVALTGFNNSNTKWTPGLKNGEKVKVKVRQPFEFKLG